MSDTAGPDWLTPDYEFVRVLGRGGAGWVALARHRPLDRLVAVKTIYGGHLDPDATSRLRREGRALARLSRPTIVRVFEILVHDHGISLVMQHAPGGDLGHALDTGAVPAPLAVTYLVQVADALTAAAEAGVVHRDVKAANVLLDGRGGALLGDFGLARFHGNSGEFRTVAGAVTGTPLYMAPEQSDPGIEATVAADAYAFAVLAYRMLTGVHPFRAATLPQIQLAHRTVTPTPPWEVTAQFPHRAGRAVLAGLAKNPDRRISPAELVAELTRSPAGSWQRLVPSASPTTDRGVAGSASGTSMGPQGDATGVAGTPAEVIGRELTGREVTGIDLTDADRGTVHAAAGRPGVAAAQPGLVEQWVVAPVYVPPRRRNRRRILLLWAVCAGIIAGGALYLLVRA